MSKLHRNRHKSHCGSRTNSRIGTSKHQKGSRREKSTRYGDVGAFISCKKVCVGFENWHMLGNKCDLCLQLATVCYASLTSLGNGKSKKRPSSFVAAEIVVENRKHVQKFGNFFSFELYDKDDRKPQENQKPFNSSLVPCLCSIGNGLPVHLFLRCARAFLMTFVPPISINWAGFINFLSPCAIYYFSIPS